MPLLHRKPFVRQKPPADLKPDEEVFYCRMTIEIFRNYDDFFERTILCNSLVWSCAITGKPGLTYQEALESENKARQNLQNFPEQLVVPILHLTTLACCSRLHELCDDLYAYTKDRYFAGEIVEVTSNSGLKQTCKILEVLTPPLQNGTANGHISSRAEDVVIVISDESDNEEQLKSAGASVLIGKKRTKIDLTLFRYKVQPLKTEGNEIIIKSAQMNRKKHQYSQDKLKLFLKQHCELRHGMLKVKSATVDKYKLSEQNFSHLFPDDPSTFIFNSANRGRAKALKNRCSSASYQSDGTNVDDLSKYRNKSARESEKMRRQKEEMRAIAKRRKEEELANEIQKRKEVLEAKKKEKEDKEKKKEELKKILEEEKMKRKEEKERLKLEKEKEREKLREEKRKYAEYLKEWNKPREDMECEDLKELPVPMPVKTRLSPELFGDALMVLEFLHAFGDLFDLQDEFPDGMTLEILEEALVGNDTEGPLCELLFFFLTAIFQAHAEEEEVAKEQFKETDPKDLTDALDEDLDSTKSAVSAVAAFAAAWPQLYQGCTLRDLDLDSCTLSEILRLHILAAGADVTPANAKYRYQQQGGFDATDNACVEFRLSNPGLLKKLTNTPVYDLTPAEKLKVLHALCGQLLTLVSTRDFIEDNVEILKQTRQEFRELKAEQHRRGREEAAARYRKKKEERLKEQEQKIRDRHEQIKEEEQRNSKASAIEEGTTQEEFDTSTESHESVHKDRGHDTATEDEEELGPSKRTQKGKKTQVGFTSGQNHEEMEECVVERKEVLTPEEEEALKHEQQRKEKELGGKIQNATSCTNILPLGRDRMYRRYWVLNSVPGLFVEEDYEGLMEDMLRPCPVKTLSENLESQGNKLYDKAQGNESSGNRASGKMDLKHHEPHNNRNVSQDQNSPGSPLQSLQPSTSKQDQNLDPSYVAELHRPVNKPNRWCFYSSPEQLNQLIEALNSRGNRENSLKETLLQEKDRLTELLTNFPVERFNIPDKAFEESKNVRSTSKGVPTVHDTSVLPAEKQLELRLKDLLLDIEDRTWQGTLGGIKVMERYAWREALETRQYELLTEATSAQNGIRILENGFKENGAIKFEGEEAKELEGINNRYNSKDRPSESKTEMKSSASTSASTPQPVDSAVRYLAIALLQLEQGIERKFLKPPLGDSDDVKKEQKDKKRKDDKKKRDEDQFSEKDGVYYASDGGKVQKTLLDRWRESLVACSSLAQVFIHLSTLDRSIVWAKSLLNARCKICHKKGDAENMLLCDGCDRGYHTYCLRPKVKIIPEDDWFCPECRPKQRFRRPMARQRPSLESEEEDLAQLEDLEEEFMEAGSVEMRSLEQNETKANELEKRQPRRGRPRLKLQIKGKRGKSNTAKKMGNQHKGKRRYTPRNQSYSAKLTAGPGRKRGRKLGRKPKSALNSEIKPLPRPYRRAKSCPINESFSEVITRRKRRKGRKIATSTPECSTSSSLNVSFSDMDLSQNEPIRKKRKYTRRVQQNPTLVVKTGKRGRKRKSADTVTQVSKVTGSRRSSSRHSGIHELSVCEQLIVDLVRHEDSWPFLKLVNKAQVTDYYDIIKKPVALNIIREKLNRCEYNFASDFIDDVELMFTNCFEYNPRNTSEAKAGIKLQAFFHNQVERLGLPVKSANVDHPPQPPVTKRSRI
ncbi:bromodomain adjacent to zinc finger domain protein 1A isoform X1 [Hemiscyllium ocellatum]|uniref:bromodomain adjacent to zinc finger domain protein 1A isoform X1 n=1 Tax=Hemiscyllium ocellatum TaxID=170820 RepID=UPI0029675AE8|nr:bromodomain adjacent to zinc finger domain protein 1A isoform X1 [Hemiscyllium ocellatum]XP_060685034.1 bromodomain adjacent to zinc finger domain protein 1A isoform X1 [Hemiscyllium ocellatum]XP_060685035.1 bromodomain adjacent to zinc finger domain protein 1A isoform X1 [Hemiscyllium ocellatum]